MSLRDDRKVANRIYKGMGKTRVNLLQAIIGIKGDTEQWTKPKTRTKQFKGKRK